eukprot:gnl/TRDRNA2_/TRDRNA2_151343_c0_seq1.p2 gnl/TRDRNA2_/TRDRNA2_151343_c0~~gnl/TRDRNA2_/TRDRNA2_151343_c0_seq1.p2  ORF type:complete len:111 (-),score=10.12 gnl/TRDRNA2_/TRDRNA2_151343_c0_seq1:9-341(-)
MTLLLLLRPTLYQFTKHHSSSQPGAVEASFVRTCIEIRQLHGLCTKMRVFLGCVQLAAQQILTRCARVCLHLADKNLLCRLRDGRRFLHGLRGNVRPTVYICFCSADVQD